jgi:adenosylcobinamide-GDP ribazoletransferase
VSAEPSRLADRRPLAGCRGALGLLTVLGGAGSLDPAMVVWFPLVGAALGAVLGALWLGARQVWPPALGALVVVAADGGLTGLLHLDGLADCGDGLLPPMDRERRLAVMAEPRTGAFGVVLVVVVLGLRVGALAALRPSVTLLCALWLLSRSVMAGGLLLLPSARPGGLAATLASGARRAPGLAMAGLGGLGAAGLAALWRVPAGPLAALAGLLAGLAVLGLARRRLGGVTGDVLGAAGVLAETVGLVVAAARW